MDRSREKIVFYDGECGFCNRTVRFVLKNNSDKSISFASLQSDFTKHFFRQRNWPVPDMETFYFYDHGTLYQKSTAALKLVSHIKSRFIWLKFLYVIPRSARDAVYSAIARKRHRILSGYCYVPSPEEKERFIT